MTAFSDLPYDELVEQSLFGENWYAALEELLARNGKTMENISPSRKPYPSRPNIRPDVRAEVWDKTGGKCFYCHTQTNPWRDYCIDHVKPLSKSGANDLDNLVPCCRSCNTRKSNRDVAYLLEKIRCPS